MPDERVVLVVEDSPTDAELALRALGKAGLAAGILLARDGQEALDLVFGRGAFEGRAAGAGILLILLDLKLPKVDGLEVLKAVRSDPRTREVPVVLFTSSSLQGDIDACMGAGANAYVVKPVAFELHARALREIVDAWVKSGGTSGATIAS